MAAGQARIVLVFAVSIVCLSVANVLLSAGAQRLAQLAPQGFAAHLRAVGAAWQLPLGALLMIAQFAGLMVLLGWGLPVSLVVPVFGLNYVVTALLGQLFLHEPITPLRWLGIAAVVLGVALIARGGKAP